MFTKATLRMPPLYLIMLFLAGFTAAAILIFVVYPIICWLGKKAYHLPWSLILKTTSMFF